MVSLQVVRPALAIDIEKMKADFVHGYRPGAAVFYVSTTDFSSIERTMTNTDRNAWDAQWQKQDKEFERFLSSDSSLKKLSNKYFFIWNGNHRHQAWSEFISESYLNDYEWHYHVRSIVLNTKDDVASILTAMHDINKATENSHVKTNLVHTLHRMQKVGLLPVASFKDMLMAEKLQVAQKQVDSIEAKKPWYSIPQVKFLGVFFC